MKSMSSYPTPNPKLYAAIGGGIFILILLFMFRPFAIINAGERGVVMKFGKVQDRVLDEGIHPIVPVVTSVKALSVRVQKNDIAAEASSKDLQGIKMDVAINWHINPQQANSIFQQIGDETEIVQRILNPAVSEVVKAASAKKNAEEIITKRTELKEEIDNELEKRVATYGIEIDDVSLVNISFSPDFVKAIEAKQIAEQEAKRASFEALKAEQQAQSEINRAKGKAEAQRLLRTNLTPEILQQQAIDKWDGKFPAVMGGDGTLPLININPDAVSSPAPQQ
ncbi:MAG TPA: prohibitin family protein [Oscillatoriales cyanobacterium M59_W2019_021]|nr:MAG: prohibitin family protein [Cyanobacteria bacterium J055]HIK32983.1 prohibitin family protein [Oscillatoriales cyanobacterium M4454_W2019_049]HIK53519.1 prohibitin family protein [Oscillatoriales cyanobacterium M59_W2019_021]